MREAPGAAQDELIGRELGQYRVLEVIGSGGMGVVYRARDRKLQRDVALKVLPAGALADEGARKRFRREALALSRLSHPHIASLFDFDTSGEGIDFLVMELVGGPSLDAKLKRGPLPEKEVVRLGSQIVRALVAAHEQGIVHRDLKPGNVKLTDDGLVKVLDFGLARMAPAAADAATTDTASGTVAGTPPYMSPEQLLGRDVDERTDVYAAGVVLFEMATGRRPFGEASGPQLVAKILNEPMPAVRDVNARLSPPLEQVILKATDKDRELRHQTAKELLVDLDRLALAPTASASARVGPHRPADGVGALSRRRLGAAQAGLTLAVVAAAAIAWLDRPREPRIGPTNVLVRVEPNGLQTDGSDVYYSTKFSTKGPLMAVSIEGGQPRSIPLPWQEDVHLSSLRRDPTVLLVRHGTDLWRVPLNAAPTRLEGLPAVAEASWSPRADRLAWIEDWQGSQVLWVGDDGGGSGKRLAEVPKGTHGQALSHLAWHPSGRSLSYFDRLRRLVVEVDVDGTLRRELPYVPLSDLWSIGAAWTPDGRFMVGGSQHGLLLWRTRGFGRWRSLDDVPTRLGGPTHVFTIRSTPDGRKLVAFVFRPSAEVFRLDPSSGTAGPSLLDETRAWTASYSPDGSHLAWVSADLWPGRLWVSRRDGSERLALGDTDVRPLNPLTWSPDGRWVGFSTDLQRAGVAVPFRLQLASLAEGTVQPLTLEDPSAAQVDACWSPDGRWLAYGVEGPFDEKESPYLRRVDLATRHVTRLEGSEGLWSPRCAPDGRILAMDWPAQAAEPRSLNTAVRRAHFKVRDPATGQWTPLSVELPPGTGTNAYRVLYPSWSRDGRYVYANVDGRWLVRLEVGSGRLEIVRDMTGLGGWPGTMTLDPDGNPLVTRDMTDREIVVMDLEYR